MVGGDAEAAASGERGGGVGGAEVLSEDRRHQAAGGQERRGMEVEDVFNSRRDPKFLWIRKALEGWDVPKTIKAIFRDPLRNHFTRDPYKR